MNRKEKPHFVIGVAGSSGSGKTTLATKLVAQCAAIGITGQIFSLDSYYRPLDHMSFEERKAQNYDHPDSIDSELAVIQLRDLCTGKAIQQPVYDFKIHTRRKESVTCMPTQMVVVEGLYALYFQELLNLCDFKIFVSTRHRDGHAAPRPKRHQRTRSRHRWHQAPDIGHRLADV